MFNERLVRWRVLERIDHVIRVRPVTQDNLSTLILHRIHVMAWVTRRIVFLATDSLYRSPDSLGLPGAQCPQMRPDIPTRQRLLLNQDSLPSGPSGSSDALSFSHGTFV